MAGHQPNTFAAPGGSAAAQNRLLHPCAGVDGRHLRRRTLPARLGAIRLPAVHGTGAMEPTTLALDNFYLPGYKGGGPVRSLSGLAERLGDDFDFALVTLDRDNADDRPYPGVSPGAWTEVGKVRVLYVPA